MTGHGSASSKHQPMLTGSLPPLGQDPLLITELTLVTGADEPVLESGALLVAGRQIKDVGPSAEVLARNPGLPVINGRGWLAMPGLINSHTHAAMSFFRGRGHGRENMIESFMFPAEKSLSPDLIEPLSYSYLYGGLLAGVTCFVDHYYYVVGVGKALERFGLRGVIGETIADLGGAFPDCDRTRWSSARQTIESWPFGSLVTPAIAPHAADTVSDDLLKEMASFAKSQRLPLHYHLSQTAGERERVTQQAGMSPVAKAHKAGALGPETLAVHLVSASKDDAALLRDSGTTIGFCPASQIIYENLAPIPLFVEHKLPLALGTDCAACNDTSDILAELRIFALLARDRGIGIQTLSPAETFASVTTTPAKALGLGSRIGRLRKNYLADVVFCRITPDLLPATDWFANIIFSMTARHVCHVMIDGQWRVWNRTPLNINPEQIQEQCAIAVAKITAMAFAR